MLWFCIAYQSSNIVNKSAIYQRDNSIITVFDCIRVYNTRPLNVAATLLNGIPIPAKTGIVARSIAHSQEFTEMNKFQVVLQDKWAVH